MSYLDRMVTATFADIAFLTESHDTKSGRRLVVHEFPGAEQPDVEDLGGKADEFSLNAYCIGADYDLARDKLLIALNTPGAAWLHHPWRGVLWVRAHHWTVHESNDKGGYCTISISFVPGGQTQSILVDRTDLADRSIKIFAAECELSYSLAPLPTTQLANLIALVQRQLAVLDNLLAMATLPLTMLAQVRHLLDGIKGDAAALLAIPAQYAAALHSFANLLGSADAAMLSDTARPQVVSSIVAMAQLPVGQADAAALSPALLINMRAEAALRSQLLLSSAAQLALADYRVAGDRDAALASVVRAIDALLPAMPDMLFQAALDMRATLTDALLAQNLAPAQVRDIVSPLPATLLAHRLGVSVEVFLAVNKVRHPLFVQGRVYG